MSTESKFWCYATSSQIVGQDPKMWQFCGYSKLKHFLKQFKIAIHEVVVLWSCCRPYLTGFRLQFGVWFFIWIMPQRPGSLFWKQLSGLFLSYSTNITVQISDVIPCHVNTKHFMSWCELCGKTKLSNGTENAQYQSSFLEAFSSFRWQCWRSETPCHVLMN